jgi:hypothetical protein
VKFISYRKSVQSHSQMKDLNRNTSSYYYYITTMTQRPLIVGPDLQDSSISVKRSSYDLDLPVLAAIITQAC